MQLRAPDLSTNGLCLLAETVSLQRKTSECCNCCKCVKENSTCCLTGLNNRSLMPSHPRTFKDSSPYHSHPAVLTLTLGNRYVPALFWLLGEPVGSIEHRVHPLNNKARQSMRAMSKQVMLQTKDSFDNIGTAPGGQSMKRANGSKPTFAKTKTS